MKDLLIYPIGATEACRYAADILKDAGVPLVDHPTPEVSCLLLDVPSFSAPGILRGGGELRRLLSMLPPDITVIGGNLNDAALATYRKLDLLQDAEYLAVNAAITGDCALQVAAPLLKTTFSDSPALVIGWGRIGKCLAQLLRSVGSDVIVAARKEPDRAILRALGYRAVDISGINQVLPGIRVIFNTVPEMVLTGAVMKGCKNCVKIDLASKPGIEGEDVVWARGLPGAYAPESSGRLIAGSILNRIREDEL